MDLGDGGRGQGLFVEVVQEGLDGLAPGLLDDGAGLSPGEGRHPVLKLCQFIGQVRRQQVAAGGKDLAELDEDGPQLDEGFTDACRIGLGVGAAMPVPGGEVGQEIDGPEQMGGE